MKFNNDAKAFRASLLTACVLALSACGGGGDGASAPAVPPANGGGNVTPTPPPPSGQVDGPFAPSLDKARYAGADQFGSAFGRLTDVQQDPSGAYRAIGGYKANADTQIIDLAGNASYAMGAWLGGSYTIPSGVTETDNRGGVYYAVYNQASSVPESASFSCQAHLSSTRGNSGETGSVTGSATLAIAASLAQAQVALTVTAADGSQIPVSHSATFGGGSYGFNIGALLAGGSGVGIGLGEASGGGFVLISPWKAVAKTGVRYQGIAVFTCQ